VATVRYRLDGLDPRSELDRTRYAIYFPTRQGAESWRDSGEARPESTVEHEVTARSSDWVEASLDPSPGFVGVRLPNDSRAVWSVRNATEWSTLKATHNPTHWIQVVLPDIP